MVDRMNLRNGTTLRDVYNDFTARSGGAPYRTADELRAVIHETDLRYDECERLTISYDWAQGFECDADPLVTTEDEAEEACW